MALQYTDMACALAGRHRQRPSATTGSALEAHRTPGTPVERRNIPYVPFQAVERAIGQGRMGNVGLCLSPCPLDALFIYSCRLSFGRIRQRCGVGGEATGYNRLTFRFWSRAPPFDSDAEPP
jgi:hypothetical protein